VRTYVKQVKVLGALVGLLPGLATASVPKKLPPPVERGEELWLENCWHCHGKRALGDGPLAEAGPVPAPALAGRVPEDRETWIVAVHRGQGTMPAFAPVIDRSAIRAVLTWLDELDPETGDGPSLEKKAEEEKAAKAKKKDDGNDDAEKPDADAEEGNAPANPDGPDANEPAP